MLDVRPAEPAPDGTPAVLLAVKAVPGARREQIVGPLGDRLKVRVSAPAEGGRANKAICVLLAGVLGVKPGRVSVYTGASNPEKVIHIEGVTPGEVLDRLS